MTQSAKGLLSLAIVLRRFDYGETSQVGRLFSRELGRLPVMARGIKRTGPELRGPMDLFALAETEVLERPRADMYLLTRYRVVTGFPGLRRNLERLNAAYVVTEILREGTQDLDPSPALFDSAVATLAALESAYATQCASILAWWAVEYLRQSGQFPTLSECVQCGAEAPENRVVRIPVTVGGVVCRSCLGTSPYRLWSLRPIVRHTLETLSVLPTPELVADLSLDGETRHSLRDFLAHSLQFHLDKELKSLSAWES
jgi:DNA repair protein RecO (recombination protein O)